MSDTKSKVKVICKAAAFLVILAIVMTGLFRVFRWKDTSGNYLSMTDSYKQLDKNTVDAVFIGPSLTYNAINPAVIWDRTGVSAFTYAISGIERVAPAYMARELLKTQKPKVMFVELSSFNYDSISHRSNVYRELMSMPLSSNVINFTKDEIQFHTNLVSENDFWNFILRWPIVHTRYKEFTKYDFVQKMEMMYSLGYAYSDTRFYNEFEIIRTDARAEIPKDIEEKIDELMTIARDNDMEIVFYLHAGYFTEKDLERQNSIRDYIENRKGTYLDLRDYMEEMDLYIPWDYIDYGHCNYSGAEKISAFFSDYIEEHFALTDHRGDSAYAIWDRCFDYYERYTDRGYSVPGSAGYILKSVADKDNMLVIVSLCGDFRDNEELHRVYSKLGYDESVWEKGECGMLVFEDGVYKGFLPATGNEEYLSRVDHTEWVMADGIRIAVNQAQIFDIFGATENMYVYIYDKMLLENTWNDYVY